MADSKSKTSNSKPKTNVKTATVTSTGGKTMKLSDVKPIELTQEEFDAKTPAEMLALVTTPLNILSPERSKELLVNRIKEGKLNSMTPEILMNWTYKIVQVNGVVTDSPGKKAENAAVVLTQDEFKALDAVGRAELILAHSHKRRVADKILPALIAKGMPLTASDYVYVTNGRIEVEGVTVAAATRSSRPAIVDGITFE